MKKLLFLLAIISASAVQAQSTRNDSYASIGLVTSFNEIPFGLSLNIVEKEQIFGFYAELKWNRLSFDSDYIYAGNPVAIDTLRNAVYEGAKGMVKMINVGTVFNPQEYGVMDWDFIDIDFCLGLGYIQDFRYKFYYDENGYDVPEDNLYSSPLGGYYVTDYNRHGVNLNLGVNLSRQGLPFMLHIGYDTKPKTYALGLNWKVK